MWPQHLRKNKTGRKKPRPWSELFRYDFSTQTWTSIRKQKTQADDYLSTVFVDSKGQVYLGSTAGVFISSDFGKNWKKIKGSVSGTPYSIYADQKGSTVFVATWQAGVEYSTDSGESWKRCDGGLGRKPAWIQKFAESGGNLYAAAYYDGVYQWNSELKSWNLLQPIGAYLFDLKSFGGAIFGTYRTDNWPNGDDGSELFKLKDGIHTSIKLSGSVNDVTAIAIKSENQIIIASATGIFSTVDGGVSWISLSDIVDVDARSVLVDQASKKIILGTMNAGVLIKEGI